MRCAEVRAAGAAPAGAPRLRAVLSARQELILRLVVDAYLESAQAGRLEGDRRAPEVDWGPSTVRAELAALEAAGYLTHPHTSAGRVPTDSGYRCYVDLLLESGPPAPDAGVELELSRLRREVDEAMRETTAALAQVTDLMALVTAPPPSIAATIHRVEVLRLQPTRVMVVAIASTGAVTKRVFNFDVAGRPRPRRVGLELPERVARRAGRRRADDRRPPRRPRARAGRVASSSRTLGERLHRARRRADDTLYIDGAARLLSDDAPRRPAAGGRADDRARAPRRASCGMLRSALDERSVFLWIGDENPQPELRSVSVVGANYGLGHRNLGSVGVVGPLRMDYATAIASVRDAARELSRYCETVYGG